MSGCEGVLNFKCRVVPRWGGKGKPCIWEPQLPRRELVQNTWELSRGEHPLINCQQVVLGCPAVPKKPLRVLREEGWGIRARTDSGFECQVHTLAGPPPPSAGVSGSEGWNGEQHNSSCHCGHQGHKNQMRRVPSFPESHPDGNGGRWRKTSTVLWGQHLP